MSDAVLSGESLVLPRPVVYPERTDPHHGTLDRIAHNMEAYFVAGFSKSRTRRLSQIVGLTAAHEEELAGLDEVDLRGEARVISGALRRSSDFGEADISRSFAIIREVSRRLLSKRHFDVQLIGGYALLRGMIAEMATGEGKTLTATLAAGTAYLAGVPVHVVTVNDYLAARDAEVLAPLYNFLGARVGTAVHGQSPAERRAAYECDITYCTNKELAFDYLRDRMVLGQRDRNLQLKFEKLFDNSGRTGELLLRGLHFAIVDEADSVLVDEARTPLIISGEGDSDADREAVEQALELGERLEEGQDYRLFTREHRVELTPVGRETIGELSEGLGGPWRSPVLREELASQALTAVHLFQRDEHYLVRDGKVQIIDEYTGRVMEDRFWSEGLHQMIEHKEGCELSSRRLTLARMTYQRFFRRYNRLSGMTGTARQVAKEFWSVYRLPVVSIPTNRPLQRLHHADRVEPTAEKKWAAITGRVRELHERGLAVLLGTRSVAASEGASARLNEAGLDHVVLNAAQDSSEAEIVAEAGQSGRITIATNMAGRGTDIILDEAVIERGGLHVIMSERHDARRIDDQLAGRAGRQGEPGSFEAILSLEDPLMETGGTGLLRALTPVLMPLLGPWVGRWALRFVQRRTERLHSRMRRDLLRSDENQNRTLAFSGHSE